MYREDSSSRPNIPWRNRIRGEDAVAQEESYRAFSKERTARLVIGAFPQVPIAVELLSMLGLWTEVGSTAMPRGRPEFPPYVRPGSRKVATPLLAEDWPADATETFLMLCDGSWHDGWFRIKWQGATNKAARESFKEWLLQPFCQIDCDFNYDQPDGSDAYQFRPADYIRGFHCVHVDE